MTIAPVLYRRQCPILQEAWCGLANDPLPQPFVVAQSYNAGGGREIAEIFLNNLKETARDVFSMILYTLNP